MEGGHSLLENMLCDEDAEPTDLPISLLRSITNNFTDAQQIGSGGFAVVYKGLLENGEVVAVKKLSNSIGMDENRYIEEVRCLMRVKHRNIIRFLGYCANTQGKMLDFGGKFVMADLRERLLCFEYVPNGTLKDYITDASSGLEWRKRYQIIKGICEGLHYLHEMRIVHLDLKPSNILLDDDMVPKIADFGISRCFDQGQSWVTATKLAGTPGYLAPEAYTRKITFKLDMYSLGVIMIETLTGQKGYSSVENVLESWRNRLRTSTEIDTVLGQIRVCFEISMDCMEFNPEKRPMTKRIIELLMQTECMDKFNETGVQMPHGKLEFLEGRQNGGVTNIKQGLVTAFGDDEKPPTSNAVDMGNMKVDMSTQSSDISHKMNSAEQPPSKNVSLERRSLEVATEKFIGHESSESSGLESLEDLTDSLLPMLEREYMQGVPISEVVLDRSFSESSKKAECSQKKILRDIKKPGETIIKGHRSYYLMLSLQLGIRYNVGKIAPLAKREVRASDFGPKANLWMDFPKEGSRLTPPHPAEYFKWKDYCPMVFRNLREMFKIDDSDYMTSICGNSALRELPSGKSGSVFFLSQDDRFMIKRLRKSEVQVLLRMLPNYYHHVRTYENTLITKIFGLHRVKPSSSQKFRFVVMGNMFCSELRIHRRFDLKGLSLGRSTDEIEIDENTILKDMDLNYSFYLEPSWREALLKQIETDIDFLRTQRIMDYSLLLGVHYRAPRHFRTRASYRRSMVADRFTAVSEEDAQEDDALNYPEGLVQSSGENSVVVGPHIRGSRLRASTAGFGEVDLLLPGTGRLQIQLGVNMPARAERIPEVNEPFREVYDVVLYLGIIDILQEYNMTKKIEHAVKSMQYDSVSISAVDPQFYSERFLKFIQTVFPENS